MARLCAAPTHAVDKLRRGLYQLTVYDRAPNPTGRHIVEWFAGNRRAAFRRLDVLLALPASFRASGQRLPAREPGTSGTLRAAVVCEAPGSYQAGPHVGAGRPGASAVAPLPLGHVVATPGALDLVRAYGLNVVALVRRHAAGDWGTLCAHDRQANARALRTGARVMSVYPTAGGPLWVITEADRSATTVLLPSEY